MFQCSPQSYTGFLNWHLVIKNLRTLVLKNDFVIRSWSEFQTIQLQRWAAQIERASQINNFNWRLNLRPLRITSEMRQQKAFLQTFTINFFFFCHFTCQTQTSVADKQHHHVWVWVKLQLSLSMHLDLRNCLKKSLNWSFWLNLTFWKDFIFWRKLWDSQKL